MANFQTPTTITILDGPSRASIIDALKYTFEKGVKLPLEFTVKVGTTAPPGEPDCANVGKRITGVKVLGFKYEGDSGESFIIEGMGNVSELPWSIPCNENGAAEFSAWYSTKGRRHGTLKFIDKDPG